MTAPPTSASEGNQPTAEAGAIPATPVPPARKPGKRPISKLFDEPKSAMKRKTGPLGQEERTLPASRQSGMSPYFVSQPPTLALTRHFLFTPQRSATIAVDTDSGCGTASG
jgi:hypothetical protein